LCPVIQEQEEPFVPAKGLAEMIRKVYEVDPLVCPSCGGKMLVIAFSEDPKIKFLSVLYNFSSAYC
jgi:hypothetical protein